MITVLAVVFVLGVLVSVHEMGHFLAARSVGVRVERFSLGYPPRLASAERTPDGWRLRLFFFRPESWKVWRWVPVVDKIVGGSPATKKGTEYCLALIPLGGYVKMAGLVDESLDTTVTGAADEFTSKNRLQQAWVLVAGVLMNALLPMALFAGLILARGLVEPSAEPVIREVLVDSPAASAGLQAGDRFLTVDGARIAEWSEVTKRVRERAGQPLSLQVERDSKLIDVTVVPEAVADESGETIGRIGVGGGFVTRKAGVIEAASRGILQTFQLFKIFGASMAQLVTGNASLRDLGGPILIAKLAGQSAAAGWDALITFTAYISINLAFLNLLPIPGLDGGHIFLLVVEGVVRRPLSVRVKLAIQRVGMAILFTLILLTLYNDLSRVLGG